MGERERESYPTYNLCIKKTNFKKKLQSMRRACGRVTRQLVEELQDKRWRRQSLRFVTSLSFFNRFCHTMRSSHTLEIMLRLDDVWFLKTFPFLASQTRHSKARSTNGHKV